jgi:hypothetical protein
MSETLFLAGLVDLEALDQFLMSDASPESLALPCHVHGLR